MISLAALVALAALQSGECPETEIEVPRSPGSACIGSVTDDYEFTFAWPVEVARVAGLEAMLRAEAASREDWMRRESAVSRRERAEAGAEPIRFSYAEGWSVDLSRAELAAASGSAQSYTGGAHGGIEYHTILIDPRARRRLALADLFTDARIGLAAVQASFCPALRRDVAERREGEDYAEIECPPAAEHPVTLIAGDDGRAAAMMALLNPYVVGSWAEGPYDVQFPITPELLEAMKPEYRGAFALPAE